MRGGRSYGGRGSMRGNGQYRSSNRMDNTNRTGGSRFKDNYNSGGPNNRGGSTRFQSNYGGNNSNDGPSSSSGHYDSRSRNKFSSSAGGNTRHDVNLSRKNYRDSREDSRDRVVDRKRIRHDDYRRTNTTASTSGGRFNRTPPPPPSLSSATSHYRGNNTASISNNNNNNHSTYRNVNRLPNSRIGSSATGGTGPSNATHTRGVGAAAGGTKLTPRYRNANNRLGLRTNHYKQRDALDENATPNARRKILRNSRLSRDAAELRIMRRKLLLAQHKDRAHVVRIARLSSNLRRSRLDQRSKSPRRAAARSHKSPENTELSPFNRSKSSRERNSDDQHKKNDTETVKKRKSTSPRTANYKSNRGKSIENTSNELTATDSTKIKDDKDERKNNKKRDVVAITVNSNEADKSTTAATTTTNTSSTATTNKNESDNDNSNNNNNNNNDKIIKKDKTTDHAGTTDVVASISEHGETAKRKNDKTILSSKSSVGNVNGGGASSDNNASAQDDDDENDDDDNDDDASRDGTTQTIDKAKNKLETEPRRFIKLTCVNCHQKCTTFKQYSEHLYSYQHKAALRQIGMRQRAYLLRLRARQRAAQREIEKNNKEDYEPKFCYLCRLHYRQQKAKHQLSQHHKAMRKFLLPYCALCRIAFKSPLSYEIHRCSLEHIRCKANSGIVETESETEMDTNEIDLNQFLTVDSVGEIDLDRNPMDDDNDDIMSETGSYNKKNTEDEDLNNTFGETSFIKRIDAYYCELCKEFSKTNINMSVFIEQHCAEDKHQRLVIEYEEKLLNEQKIKLQQQLEEEEAKEKQEKELQEKLEQEKQLKEQNEKKAEEEAAAATKEELEKSATVATVTTTAKVEETKEAESPHAQEKNEKEAEKASSTSDAQLPAQKPNISSDAEKIEKEHHDNNNEDDDDAEEKLWADVDKDLGDLLAVMSSEVQGNDDDEDEDESVLNIDIESEKPKLKEKEVNGKKEDIILENPQTDNQFSASENKATAGDAKNTKIPSTKERPAAQRRQIKKTTNTTQK